ncbi:MAG: efflux transporter outer membrane subunit [Candidatus Omnitrophota bacterium]
MFRLINISLLVILLALGGCATGTSVRPALIIPTPKTYTSGALSEKTLATNDVPGGNTQQFVLGDDIPAQWWQLFKSEELNRIIRMALSRNPTLAGAQATLREAQENYNARVGSEYYPDISANLSMLRQKSSPAAAGLPDGTKGSIFNLHHASIEVSYTFDIFGSGRKELESLKASVDYQRFQFEAAYLTLTANIVTTVIKEASLREQLSAFNDILSTQEKHLSMLDQQMALGASSRTEILAQRAQLEQTRASLPSIEKELSQVRHQLMVLMGKTPDEESGISNFSLSGITLPEDIPISLPSTLVRQRPDIQAAEALLNVASARVGVATANLYPQIILNGSYGAQAARLENLFDANNMVWNIGAGLIQPIFNGGRLRAQRRSAIAGFEAASAQFCQTVLLSYANVADALRALETDSRTLKAQSDAFAAARDSLEMTQQQLSAGAVNYILLLNAQRQYQQARISLIQARAARLSDTAALFQALGGGWWNRTEPLPVEKLKE